MHLCTAWKTLVIRSMPIAICHSVPVVRAGAGRTASHTAFGTHASALHTHAIPWRAAGATTMCHAQHSRPVMSHAYSDLQRMLLTDEGVSYDAEQNAAYWETRPVTVIARLITIASTFGRWWLRAQLQHTDSAAELRDVLITLGPAFVKIGQLVSSRPDVIPPAYLRELEKLQDDIPPFPTDEAFAVMREDLQQPPSQLFESISKEPVAAASLGQVYKAYVRGTGEAVAVKVQRPGVVDTVALDLYILRRLAVWVAKVRRLNTDLSALIDDWSSSIFRELDYRQEARNGNEFKRLFSHMNEVYVPTMYERLTTTRVLVMEWVDGRKVTKPPPNESERVDDLRLVDVGVRCSLEQMLQEGFYHADPHPGNILKMDDGRLAYLDFGMMGRINRPIRQGLIRATLHMVNREFEYLADDFVTLGLLPDASMKEQVVPALTGVFQKALAGGVSNLSFSELSGNLGKTMYDYKFRIPAYYTLLVRSLTILEGIALVRDPNYKVLSAAYPWIARRMLTDQTPELRATARALLYRNGKFQFHRLESLLEQAVLSPARSENIAATAPPQQPTSSRANPSFKYGGALQLLLSPDADYVREILIDELAKGVDATMRMNFDATVSSAKRTVLSYLGVQTTDEAELRAASLPAGQVVSGLLQLPSLADKDDHEQVEGINKLANAVQRLAVAQETQQSTSGAATADTGRIIGDAANTDRFNQMSLAFNWIVREARGLPADARAEALKIPLQLASSVSSRITARAIRAALTPPPQRIKPVPPVQRATSTPLATTSTTATATASVSVSPKPTSATISQSVPPASQPLTVPRTTVVRPAQPLPTPVTRVVPSAADAAAVAAGSGALLASWRLTQSTLAEDSSSNDSEAADLTVERPVVEDPFGSNGTTIIDDGSINGDDAVVSTAVDGVVATAAVEEVPEVMTTVS